MVRQLILIGLLCSGIASADSRQRAVERLNTLQMTRVGQGVKPASLEVKQPRVGAEILEIQSPTSIRAWISPAITREEFAALEVDQGWRKNQPRTSSECGPDEGRFLKSPDASEDGDILVQPFYGYEWFHSATIFATDVFCHRCPGGYQRSFTREQSQEVPRAELPGGQLHGAAGVTGGRGLFPY